MSEDIQPGEVKIAVPEGDTRPVEQEELTTLSAMTRDFAFFTPALLLTHGRFEKDPMREFNAFRPTEMEDERPFAVDSVRPFFQGLGVHPLPDSGMINWDNRIYGIARHRWPELESFVGAIAVYDPRRYHYARVVTHALMIVDPTAMGSGMPMLLHNLPSITITVFGMSTNRGIHYLAPATDPPRTRAFPNTRPADQRIVIEAEAVLGPPPDPSQLAKRLYPKEKS